MGESEENASTQQIRVELITTDDKRHIFVSDIKNEVETEFSPSQIKVEPPELCDYNEAVVDSEINFQATIKTEDEPNDVEIKKEPPPEVRPKNKNIFYSCTECEFMTKFKWCYDDHIATNHQVETNTSKADKLFQCKSCDYNCRSEYGLRRHIKYRHEPRVYNCTYCDHKTKDRGNLRKHVIAVHLKIKLNTVEYRCLYCEYKTDTKSNLWRHTFSKHYKMKNNKCEYSCDFCEYTSRDKSNFKRHVLSKHEFFKCTYCEFTTKKQDYLRVHMKKHSFNRVRCPHCESTFSHNKYLILHIKTYHSSENLKHYKCHNCSFESTRREDLVRHIPCEKNNKIQFETVIVKTEDKSNSNSGKFFNCDQCPYKTNKKSNLSKHRVSQHTDVNKINWIQCEHCSYKAKTKEYYKKHVKTHAKGSDESDKLFKCEQCSYSARSKSGLERHRVVQHTSAENITWIQCTKCEFKAKTKDIFYNHRYYKHSDFAVTYKCDQCEFVAKTRSQLGVHIVSKHPVDVGESVSKVEKKDPDEVAF